MVTSSLLCEMYDAKLNKDFALPVTSDLVKLLRFIGNSLQNAMREMQDFPSEDNYFKLARLAPCKITVF